MTGRASIVQRTAPNSPAISDCKACVSGLLCSAGNSKSIRVLTGRGLLQESRWIPRLLPPMPEPRNLNMMSKAQKIRVLIADDHAILRSGLRMLINAQIDMEVVGEAANGDEAVHKVQEFRPDVAILDLTMPEAGGLKAVGDLSRRSRTTRVLVLTMHAEPAYLRTALAAGALGYVLKKSVDADLLSAIRAVHQGKTYVDPELADHLVRDALRGTQRLVRTEPRQSSLSERELQVLRLVAEGF